MSCELVLIFGYFLLFVTDETDVYTTTVAKHRNVVGYISVRFTPEILRVTQGSTETGHVHVTEQSSRYSVDNSVRQRALRACVVDQSVVTASWYTADTERRTDVAICSLLPSVYEWETTDRPKLAAIYSVNVRGILLGRSAVRFYVIKKQTGSNTAGSGSNDNQTEHTAYNELSTNDDLVATPQGHVTSHYHVTTARATGRVVTQYNANYVNDDVSYARVVCRLSVNVTDCLHAKTGASYVMSVTERWWIADEYQIVVVSPVRRTTTDLLCYLILTLTAINLVGIGGQLDCDEATKLLRRPSALAVGLFCRFAVMPVVSLHINYI